MSEQIQFANKAARLDFNQKEEILDEIAGGVSDIPLATESQDGMMSKNDKVAISALQSEVDGKATTSDLTSALADKADTLALTSGLSDKTDKTTTSALDGRVGVLETDKATLAALNLLTARVEVLETALSEE